MTQTQALFLRALGCALRGQLLPDRPEVTPDQWQAVLELASSHRVLPLV